MKLLLLSAFAFTFVSTRAQSFQPDLQKMLKDSKVFQKPGVRSSPGKNQTELDQLMKLFKKATPNSKSSPGVHRSKVDGMPYIVPDMSAVEPMPNAWNPNSDTKPVPMPNAAKPEERQNAK